MLGLELNYVSKSYVQHVCSYGYSVGPEDVNGINY